MSLKLFMSCTSVVTAKPNCIVDTAHLDILISVVPSDSGLPLQVGRQLQLACNVYTDPAVDLSACGWLHNDQPFYLFNNHKYIVYYTPEAGETWNSCTQC